MFKKLKNKMVKNFKESAETVLAKQAIELINKALEEKEKTGEIDLNTRFDLSSLKNNAYHFMMKGLLDETFYKKAFLTKLPDHWYDPQPKEWYIENKTYFEEVMAKKCV